MDLVFWLNAEVSKLRPTAKVPSGFFFDNFLVYPKTVAKLDTELVGSIIYTVIAFFSKAIIRTQFMSLGLSK